MTLDSSASIFFRLARICSTGFCSRTNGSTVSSDTLEAPETNIKRESKNYHAKAQSRKGFHSPSIRNASCVFKLGYFYSLLCVFAALRECCLNSFQRRRFRRHVLG